MKNCTLSPIVFLYFTENEQNIRFRNLLCPEWPWVLPAAGPPLFWALQGPPGARSSQPRESRRSHLSRGIHWCHDLPKKTTGTPTLDRQNAPKAPHQPHSEGPRCPKTAGSSPSEGTKATTNLNVATTTSIQVPEAPQSTPTLPISITTPAPVSAAQPPQRRRASGSEFERIFHKIRPSG